MKQAWPVPSMVTSSLSGSRSCRSKARWWLLSSEPVMIITGSEDNSHQRAFDLHDRLPDSELVTMEGTGHACFMEQPWVWDRHLLEFLDRRGLRKTSA